MTSIRRAAIFILSATLLISPLTAGAVAATRAPSGSAATTASTAPLAEKTSATIGPTRVSVDTSGSVVPVGGEFRFAAEVQASTPLEYLQVRLRVFAPDKRLMYQKTLVAPNGRPGVFEYARTTSDLGLSPGVYPAEISVRLSSAGEVSVGDIPLSLLVYEPGAAPVRLAAVARISAQPLSDPNGHFTSDPGQFTRARDDAVGLAEYVLDTPGARLGLALSPVMLEEWQQIAGGYTFVGAEGEVVVTQDEAVPRAYAAALDTIKRALATGRLELLAAGYSDPDLAELEAAGLSGDIPAQYSRGAQALGSALETTPSAGTAPSLGRLSAKALPLLEQSRVGFVLADPANVLVDGDPAQPGLYRAEAASVTVAAADIDLARSIATSDAAGIRERVFERYIGKDTTAVAFATLDVGPNGSSASRVVSVLGSLDSAPWLELVTPAEAASSASQPTATIGQTPADSEVPAHYWEMVAEARGAATALAFSMGEANPDADRSVRNSLIAQGSAWAGPDGKWTPAEKGLGFANWASRKAEDVFGLVSLSAKPVTLAGDSGKIPITAINSTSSPLRVMLVLEPGRSMNLGVPMSQELMLEPGENYIEIPARLLNVLSSTLTIRLQAADTEIATTDVTLSASYLDRIVMIAGIAVLLVVLLAFIIRRVRAAEREGTCASDEDVRPLCSVDGLASDAGNADDALQ